MDHPKVTNLRQQIRAFESAVVAFSGGVDSTLLARLAYDELGSCAVAVTAVSPSLAARELAEAQDLARGIGIAHVLIDSQEVQDARYQANNALRCYWCKHEVYGQLVVYARQHGFQAVMDGMNLDDTHDVRPGQRAAREYGIHSPLLKAGLTKAEVRALARALGLPNWNKPAMACLSSRIPYGTPIRLAALSQVEQAENYLRDLGLRQVRVRHHGEVARLEIEVDDFAALLAAREQVVAELRALGFAYVALDLAGYQTGSLNELLKVDDVSRPPAVDSE